MSLLSRTTIRRWLHLQMLLSGLLSVDGDSMAAELDRIVAELRRLRSELGDDDEPQV
jgi:hypothetical protein